MINKYSVILADPPWKFEVWEKGSGSDRAAEKYYPTLSLEDICAIPVANIAADNCALFIWCVWPSLFDARHVIEAWGFTYRTLGFEWIKLNKSGYGPHMGLGYYTRSNSEPCLLAVRGSMPVQNRGKRNLIFAPVSDHSAKPNDQYTIIEDLYPETKKIELFTRNPRNGWDYWGNNVKGGIDIYGT